MGLCVALFRSSEREKPGKLSHKAQPEYVILFIAVGTKAEGKGQGGKESGYRGRLGQPGVPFWHRKGGECEIRADLGSLSAGLVEGHKPDG